MNISNLAIEVTRRCNMTCEHCLRGDAQNIDMDIKYVDTLFSKVDYIGSLTLTGGEPSLVSHIIEQIIKSANKYHVGIGNFYIATNAKKITPDFIFVVMKLYLYCDDNEISQINWSNDIYHDEDNEEGIKYLKLLSFANPKGEDDNDYNNGRYVLMEGRGEYIGEKEIINESYSIDDDDDRIEEGLIYLNCEGNIIKGCDWSYCSQSQEDNIISSVEDFTIDKIREIAEMVEV